MDEVGEGVYSLVMEGASRIPERIRGDAASIMAFWREERGADAPEYARLASGMERLVVVFADFLGSGETVETFSQGGATRGLVGEIAESQHELGRDAAGVIEDFAVLRRRVWLSVERSVDLSRLHGAEVARFFATLLRASDWITEAGLQAFDAIAHREMDRALGRAAATDLVTGLPDRDQFNRLLLPGAVAAHDRFSVAVFDVANFTEAVAAGRVEHARAVVGRLAEAVRQGLPEGVVCARFGDDEVAAIIPDKDSEGAYGLVEGVLEGLRADPGEFEVDVGLAEFPAHGATAGELMDETLRALKMAKRVGGGGIVVARH